MHQLLLITALSATSGLFGGKHCGKPQHHGKRAVSAGCYSASPCGATYAAPHAGPVSSGQGYMPTPQAMPSASPVAVPTAPPAVVPAAPAPPAPPASI